MKKYFDFNGTINGTDYFLRSLVGGVSFVVATSIGAAISVDASIWISILALIPLFWLNLSTINKRLNALLPENKVLGWVLNLIPYAGFIMSIYQIFGNSKIENHNG